jgi:hypothetical protein
MKKITDSDYRLPEIYALRFNENFSQSANKPVLLSGIDKHSQEKGDFVVKFKNTGRMSTDASMRELLAGFIAMQMGIPVVEPVIIEITPAFVNLLIGNEAWVAPDKSLGHNYGSIYIREHTTLLLNKGLNNRQLPLAQDIFAFDMFIQNPDRTNNKPNLLTEGNDMIILDHEIAFGFIFASFITANIWAMKDNDKAWIRDHCLFPHIKGKEFNFEGFSAKLGNLTETFWDKAARLVPAEWFSDQFETIKNILSRICADRKHFILELKKIMS